MDTPSKLGRIDSLEVFAPIAISTQGTWNTLLQNIMAIFGFGAVTEFSRDEFHFFIDCLFRGLFKLLIVKPQGYRYTSGRKKLVPMHPGRKLAPADIEKLVSQIFPSNIDILDRADFIELMQQNKEVCEILKYFHEKCNQSVMTYRQKVLDRLAITQIVRKMLSDMQKNMFLKIKEIEEMREAAARN